MATTATTAAGGAPAPTIHKSLLELVFSGAYLLRWNDKLRPRDLMEIDKQAHKMLVACVLWERNARVLGLSGDRRLELGRKIVEGGIFDYLFRMVVTDIKPPIYYKIKGNREQFAQLTAHVFKALRPKLEPLGDFWTRFMDWHRAEIDEKDLPLDRHILSAAHMFASNWEFQLIRPFNQFDQEMDAIARDFETRLREFESSVNGMDEIRDPTTPIGSLVNFCGQLRFQVRWTQAPRIPQTDVLGHMFIVACYAYFFSLSVGACRARCVNNFFSGLFHDLPELLTRDIISPVKKSSEQLEKLIKECENEQLNDKIYGPLESKGEKELVALIKFYLGDGQRSEFDECARVDGAVRKVEGGFAALSAGYNEDRFDPKDGQLIKACDNLAAFMEVHSSIRAGVSSAHLYSAHTKVRDALCGDDMPEAFKLNHILADFD